MKKFIMSLTISRAISGPFIFIFITVFEAFLVSSILFAIAALTDFLDGYLSRKFSLESKIGKVLDPIADKILLTCSLLSIILLTDDLFIAAVIMIILVREFWIAGLREFSEKNKLEKSISVSYLGKVKTSFQFIAIISFFISFSFNSSLGQFLSSFLLFLSMLLSIKSGIDYTNRFLKKDS